MLFGIDAVVLDCAFGPEEADVEDVWRVGVEDGRELADRAVLEFEACDDDGVVLVVEVLLGAGAEGGHLGDLAREVTDRVGGVAAGGDEGAAAVLLADGPGVAGVLLFERMPVVGLGVDHLAEHAVGLHLLHGLELGVPAEDE